MCFSSTSEGKNRKNYVPELLPFLLLLVPELLLLPLTLLPATSTTASYYYHHLLTYKGSKGTKSIGKQFPLLLAYEGFQRTDSTGKHSSSLPVLFLCSQSQWSPSDRISRRTPTSVSVTLAWWARADRGLRFISTRLLWFNPCPCWCIAVLWDCSDSCQSVVMRRARRK